MKYTTKRMLALLIAILLAMPTMTFAEAPVEDALIIDDAINGIGTLPEPEGDPEIEGAGDIPQLDISDDLLVEAPLQDALQPEADTVVTYCFIVNDTFVAVQEAREGDEINRPADPDTPEGQAFAGWFLGDGTALFVDADGDGMIDPVIAHPDGIVSQISVYARFAEIEATRAQTEALAEDPAGNRQRRSPKFRPGCPQKNRPKS